MDVLVVLFKVQRLGVVILFGVLIGRMSGFFTLHVLTGMYELLFQVGLLICLRLPQDHSGFEGSSKIAGTY